MTKIISEWIRCPVCGKKSEVGKEIIFPVNIVQTFELLSDKNFPFRNQNEAENVSRPFL